MSASTKTEIKQAHDQIVRVEGLLTTSTSRAESRRYLEAMPALEAARRALLLLWTIE
jgi:hypothetical protein